MYNLHQKTKYEICFVIMLIYIQLTEVIYVIRI